MNCSKKTTELKVQFIVPLLPIVEDNNQITELLRNAMPLSKIGDDYVRSVRKVWKDAGKPEDWKIVLNGLKGSHHKKERVSDPLLPFVSAQETVKEMPAFSEHEIATLKKLVWFVDAIKETE